MKTKVSDVMTPPLFTVDPETPVSEVRRLIFSLGISGFPVTSGKKLIGIVTEEDLSVYMNPIIKKVLEKNLDLTQSKDVEDTISQLLSTSAEKVMNQNIITVTPDASLTEVQSIMTKNNFSRLPVVDKNKNLVGIVSQGDILRFLMKAQIPKLHEIRYAKFLSEFYDIIVDWSKRFEYELPALLRIFKREKVNRILELGSWTGEYPLELVKHGIKRAVGLDHNPSMIELSDKKKERLPESKRDAVTYMLSDFTNFSKQVKERFDAVICLGNAISYIDVPLVKLFKQAAEVLDKERHGTLIIQVINYDKVLKSGNKLVGFSTQKAKAGETVQEHLFVEFFDKKKGNGIMHNIITFDSDGKRWTYKGLNSVPIQYITKDEVETALKQAGFKSISFGGNRGGYQGDYGQLSFTKPFDPRESDWLNVLAKR